MAIVVAPAEDSDLMQGDVLRDVPFLAVGIDGAPEVDRKGQYVLVLSRPCKALRDDVVVVAPVVPFPLELAEIAKSGSSPAGGLERMRRLLSGLRDGIKVGDFSDALYLGAFEDGATRRFAAQLTTLCTARVPTESGERKSWVNARRVGRLHVEFLRDLHTRLLLTFTRLGFDDYEWYSDADLDVMITAGEAEILHLRTELVASEQAVQHRQAADKPLPKDQKDNVERKRGDVAKAEKSLKPYLDERDRRERARNTKPA